MTWTYRTYEQDGDIIYAELEDHDGTVVRRYYPRPHPKLKYNPNIADGDEPLPDDGVPAVPVRGFNERDAIEKVRQEAHDALPEDDSEPVTAGALRKVLSLVERDVERVEAKYQGDPVDRGWNRGRGPDGDGTPSQSQGQGQGLGQGGSERSS